MILRGDIIISPPHRKSISYNDLSQLVADYLLRRMSENQQPSGGLAAALSILPSTRYGLNLNPRFGAIDGFQTSASGGELKLFALANVPLYHGWVVDPQERNGELYDLMVEKLGDYDNAVMAVCAGDDITGGLEEGESEEAIFRAVARREQWSPDDEKTVREGMHAC